MTDLNFDYAAARDAGYSDTAILDGLQQHGKLNFDLAAARKKGHDDSEILQTLLGGMRRAAEPPKEEESTSLLRRAGDVGLSALKGVISVPEAIVGLADIPTGGAAGRAAEALGVKFKESKELLSEQYSDAQKGANQRVADAKGFVDTAGAMLANPSTLVQTGVESLPSMVAGGAIGRGVMALAPRIGAVAAGAIGEGAVGAGQAAEQIRQQSADGSLTAGQAGAALASGVGTGIFGLVGGRIAQKMGISDIDTALVQVGAKTTSKGVVRRMIEGGISEGVFEELPQSMQEQIWQNVAMDRPMLEGVPEQAAQGMLAGGLFGGVAGGALHGKPQQTAPEQQPGQTPLLTNNPEPLISFPDGSVGRQSDVDGFLSGLPEDARAAARARLYGYEPQPVTPDDVLRAQSVDEAIAVAERAVAEDTPAAKAQKNAEIDAAWQQYLAGTSAQREQEFTAAEQARREADAPLMQEQAADQVVAQADALTAAQGFDEQQPTAMQLAMQEARAKRQAVLDGAAQRRVATAPEIDNAPPPTAPDAAGPAGIADPAAGAPAEPAVPAAETAAAAAVVDGGGAAPAAGNDRAAAAAATEQRAREILNAAGVTGNERLAALRAVRTGENTLEDLIDAHPPKETVNATPPTTASSVPERSTAGTAASAPVQQDPAPARADTAQLDEGAGDVGAGIAGGGRVPAGARVSDGDAARGSAGSDGLRARAAQRQQQAAREERAAAERERQDRDRRDIVARQDASAENFQLGQSADDSLSGQEPLFSKATRRAPQTLDDVRAAWDAAGIKNFISERGSRVNVAQIVVPQDARGAGTGTRAMQQLIDYADRTGKTVTLTPSADFGGTKSRLVEFYKRLGFVENKGRNRDPEISEAMYRPATDAPRASVAADEYGDSHRPPSREDGAPLNDLTGDGVIYPEDVYSANGPRYYGTGVAYDAAAFRLAKMARGNPDFDVMIYRAVPKDVDAQINAGDWVGITRQYAEDHGESRFDGEYKIISKMVKASDIFTNGDSIQEWGYDPEDGGRASTSPAATRGMAAADVTRAITRLRAKWMGFTKVNVVQSTSDLPADISERTTVDESSEGFYDPRTKSVYLIADNLASPARAAWVAAHEVVGHGGLRMLQDKSLNEALNLAGANRFVKQMANAIQQDRGDVAGNVAVEEAVAELAAAIETGDFDGLAARYRIDVPASAQNGVRGVVARVIEAVRRFLASVTGKSVPDVSDADVRALIGEQQAAVEGRGKVPEMAPDSAPARASVIPANQRTIEVDGVRRPITDSTGKLVAQDFQKQQAFYRWFKDSAVVDDKGRPLVVYHGTPNGGFSSFDAERAGANTGAAGGDHGLGGFYFTPDASIADTYSRSADVEMINEYEKLFGEPPKAIKAPNGASVYPVYLSLENPFVTERGPISEAMVREAKEGGHDGIVSGKGSYPEYVAFRAAQIKSATGNAGTFDPNSDSILQSRAAAAPAAPQNPAGEERIPKWAADLPPEQQAALRKAGAIYTEKTAKQKVKELFDGATKKLQYGILDQFAPIKDQLGQVPYMHARLAKAADGTLEAMMLYGRPQLDADGAMLVDTTKKGFVETMQQLDGEHDRFFSWLAGRRAEQLKKEGRENLFTDDDISALAKLNQGAMKDGRSREAAYLRAQKDVAELNKSVLDIAEKSGLIDAESRKVWQSDFYVPFYRVMEEGITGPSVKSGLVNQKSIKKLKGGTNNLGDLTQNMLMNWSTLLTASAKNRAAKASLDVAAKMGVASEAPESTIKAMAKSAQTRAVSYMEDGTNRWFVVEDDHLLAAISALEFNGYNNQAMKVMSTFKNWLTRAITISPYFKVRNLIRDSLSVIAVSDANYNVLKNWKDGASLLRDKDQMAQMVAGGGIFRFGTNMEGNRGENVKRLIDEGVPDDTILNTAQKMAKFTRKLYASYEKAGDLSENLNRAALYKQLRESGKSHLEASFEARDLMDFGLSGAWAGVRALNQILPFFNARLQGLYKLGRGYNDDPKRMAYVVGALALATIALSAAFKDDDDWKKRSDSDRANYWWFKIGGTAYRIPKPFEIGAAATAIDDLFALWYDSENTDGKRFATQMGELVNGQLAMNPIPQVFRPLIDVYANKDAFSGRPIESLAMQRLRPEDRYSSNTSELARLLGKSGMLVDPVSLVAGTGVKPLSPVQIDSLIKGYFAGVGVFAVSAVDGMLHHTVIDRGAALPVPLRTLTGSFAEDLPTNSSRYVDMLYKTAQDVEQTYASYQNAIKQGNIDEARKIMKDEGGTLAKYHMIESLKKNETRISQAITRIRDSRELTGEQKEEQIRRLKLVQDQIARRMVTGK